ncbi:hypothetical protein Tco_0597238 [Tanacetum coccineum]
MDDPNITIEEYIRLEEEKARRRGKVYNWETVTYGNIWDNEDVHNLGYVETEFPAIVFNDTLTSKAALSCEPTVSSLNNNEIDFRISFDESDDDDCTVIFDKNSFSYKIIYVNDLNTDSENDNDKVNMPSLPSLESTVSYFDDLDYFKDFEKEFPAIVYNDSQTSKLDFLTEPTISPQHIDEFNLKDETSLSECEEEEQNVLCFNDLFPFNVIHPNDSKSDKDNEDDKIDINSLRGMATTAQNTNNTSIRYEKKMKFMEQSIGPAPDPETTDPDTIDKYYKTVNLEQEVACLMRAWRRRRRLQATALGFYGDSTFMGDENPICTLGDYSKPSHEGYRNTIELPEGNNVRGEINNRMTEMFGLLKERTTSRVPKKVFMREEAKHPVTKNLNSIYLIKGEEENNDDENATTVDSIEKPDGSDTEMPLKEAKKENEAENRTKNGPIKSVKKELI